jgi:hypothetical protein
MNKGKTSYKKFQFFQRQIIQIQTQKKDLTLPSLEDISVSSAAICENRLFFCAKLASEKIDQLERNKNKLYVFENKSMAAEIDIYNIRFDFVQSIHPMNKYILTFGVEEED